MKLYKKYSLTFSLKKQNLTYKNILFMAFSIGNFVWLIVVLNQKRILLYLLKIYISKNLLLNKCKSTFYL